MAAPATHEVMRWTRSYAITREKPVSSWVLPGNRTGCYYILVNGLDKEKSIGATIDRLHLVLTKNIHAWPDDITMYWDPQSAEYRGWIRMFGKQDVEAACNGLFGDGVEIARERLGSDLASGGNNMFDSLLVPHLKTIYSPEQATAKDKGEFLASIPSELRTECDTTRLSSSDFKIAVWRRGSSYLTWKEASDLAREFLTNKDKQFLVRVDGYRKSQDPCRIVFVFGHVVICDEAYQFLKVKAKFLGLDVMRFDPSNHRSRYWRRSVPPEDFSTLAAPEHGFPGTAYPGPLDVNDGDPSKAADLTKQEK